MYSPLKGSPSVKLYIGDTLVTDTAKRRISRSIDTDLNIIIKNLLNNLHSINSDFVLIGYKNINYSSFEIVTLCFLSMYRMKS